MVAVSDPVGDGFVAAWPARREHHRASAFSRGDRGKRIQLLKEIVPGSAWCCPVQRDRAPSRLSGRSRRRGVEDPRGSRLRSARPASSSGALRRRRDARAGPARVREPVLIRPRTDSLSSPRARLPAIYESEYVQAGGLISYGPNLPDMWRRAAVYVDRSSRARSPPTCRSSSPRSSSSSSTSRPPRPSASRSRRRCWRGRTRSPVTPPIWLDATGRPHPTRACWTCGREIAPMRFRAERLGPHGWAPRRRSLSRTGGAAGRSTPGAAVLALRPNGGG